MNPRFPDYALDGEGSPSRYRRYEEDRGLNYYEADPNLRAVLTTHLDQRSRGWAEERLRILGKRCGTDIVRRADTYDRAGHEFVRYDRFARDVSRIAYHSDWLLNLDEVFDFGLVGWNHDSGLLARYGPAPVTLLTAFDYLVGQADMALCCPVELAHGAVVVLERFADEALRKRLLPAVVSTAAATRLQVAQVLTEITGGSDVGSMRTEVHRDGDRWLVRGEKWFASNVGAELIFTLARVDVARSGTQGLAMFIVPRRCEDGSINRVGIRRLKDKMGTIGVPTGAALDEFERTGDPRHHLRFRTLAPVIKYRSAEQNVDFARAAIEMLGGNGYVADFGTPRLLRDAQVNPIWEGTSNMCALDLWRAIVKQRGHEAVLAYIDELLDRLDSDAARRLAVAARQGMADVRGAVDYLSGASSNRQAQQARRLADLVGDTVAFAALAHEADVEARAGDYRKAIVAELFPVRMNGAETRRTAVTDAFDGVPDLYPIMFGEAAVSQTTYASVLERLTSSRAVAVTADG